MIENFSGLGQGVHFEESSNAGSAHIINYANALVTFGNPVGNASAANSTIDNRGFLAFLSNTTAGNATIITQNGGQTQFQGSATGDTASLVINGGPSPGVVTVSTAAATFTIGSLAGTTPTGGIFGQLQLGNRDLVVGSNNQSTSFAGAIVTTGSLTKIGTGTLTLSGVATQSGATNITAGGLHLVNGSMFQTTSVLVGANATLSGTGTIGVNPGVTSTVLNGTLAPAIPAAV